MASGVQCAEEDRAGMGDLAAERLGVGDAKLQMFGGDAVRQGGGLGQVAGDDDRAVRRASWPRRWRGGRAFRGASSTACGDRPGRRRRRW